MRAVRCGPKGPEVVEVPAPRGDGVRVRVGSAGICGSDLHMIDAGVATAHPLGHEIAGWTDDETPVAIEPIASCGRCDECRRGDYNLCRLGVDIVIGVARDGGMADEIRVPQCCLVPLPPGVRVEDACLVEPLAVATHGMRRGGIAPAVRVAVVGGGAIGLCAVAAARDIGATVSLRARHEAQREAGARLGARDLAADAGDEFDVVIDCAGTRASLEESVGICRPAGTLLLLASYWGGLEAPGFALCMKELRVVPAHMYGRCGARRDIDDAALLLSANPELADVLITHRLALDAAPEAFALARKRASGAIKVVLEP